MYSKKYQKGNNYSYADRFIPRRRGINVEASNYLLNRTSSPSVEVQPTGDAKFINHAYVNWKKESYRERLWSIAAPGCQKVLHFSETVTKTSSKNISHPLWPVKSRKKPLIGPPSMILDMPNLEANICHHDIDWSSKGFLASIFEGEVFLWHPDNNPNIFTNTGGKVEHCVSWSPSANHFTIAMNNSRFGIWDFNKNRDIAEAVCPCGRIECTITTLTWSSKNELISGCSLGRLCVWSSHLTLLKANPNAHKGSIITITLSCAERYLATSATDGPIIIWQWPELRELFGIGYNSPIRGIAWHPSKDSLFAVGGNIGDGSLALWSATNSTQIGFKPSPSEHCLIDNLTFNSLTGELVVSYCQLHENFVENSEKCFIEILANLEKTVDAIECHKGRVLYLLWGGDGTKLGTAGADENFYVWEFLGTSPDIIKSYKEANKKKKLSTDPFNSLSSFGQCIR